MNTDVGGGAVPNTTTDSLADIPLRWMVREALNASCALQFDPDALTRANINLDLEPSQAELELDLADAVEPLHDELKLDPLWWLLEIVPLSYSWQDAQGVWHREWRYVMGFGSGCSLMLTRYCLCDPAVSI